MLISAYSTHHDLVPHPFSAESARRRWHLTGEQDAELAAHLDELADYVERAAGSRPTIGTKTLLRHLADVQRWYSFTIDEHDPAELVKLTEWADQATAVLLAGGSLVDGAGRPLLPGEHGAATGQLPLTTTSIDRADEIRTWLASARGAQVADTLPPVRSEAEVIVRDAYDVGLRIIALVMTSDFATSLIAGKPLDPRAMQAVFPRAMAALSPAERELFDRRDPQTARTMRPRMEAANELLWATDRTTLGWPSSECDTAELKRIVLSRGEPAFLADLQLRATDELLVEYECIASLMWAVDEDQQRHGPPVPDTDPQIVAQRLAALSWLVNRQLTWDEADYYDRTLH